MAGTWRAEKPWVEPLGDQPLKKGCPKCIKMLHVWNVNICCMLMCKSIYIYIYIYYIVYVYIFFIWYIYVFAAVLFLTNKFKKIQMWVHMPCVERLDGLDWFRMV
jgi:hypothetical protein